jgi:hypothetical protein
MIKWKKEIEEILDKEEKCYAKDRIKVRNCINEIRRALRSAALRIDVSPDQMQELDLAQTRLTEIWNIFTAKRGGRE